jgi:hypothetical protein
MSAVLLAATLAVLAAPADSSRGGAVRLFIDCSQCSSSNLEYLRNDITFVDHVRDRAVADVQLLITTQTTGGGGDELTLTLIGLGPFAGVNDTLRYLAKPAESDAATLEGMSQMLKLGLVRYIARTPEAPHLKVSYVGGAASATPQARADHWNGWVFSTSMNGFFNGQTSFRSTSLWGSQSISRVRLRNKVGLTANANYNENHFDLSDGSSVLSISRSQYGRVRSVWALRDHWSGQLSVNGSTSTFGNEDLGYGATTGLEYNLFPYTQSTRRQLRFDYYLSYQHENYVEETIFDKTREDLAQESVEINLHGTEPWGSTDLSVYGAHYLHDVSKNRLQTSGSISLNLVQGLSVSVSGFASRPRDQLALPKTAATPEEILLQRRALATEFEYFVSVGFTYTFGSIFNNVVNARFGTGT